MENTGRLKGFNAFSEYVRGLDWYGEELWYINTKLFGIGDITVGMMLTTLVKYHANLADAFGSNMAGLLVDVLGAYDEALIGLLTDFSLEMLGVYKANQETERVWDSLVPAKELAKVTELMVMTKTYLRFQLDNEDNEDNEAIGDGLGNKSLNMWLN